MQRARRPTHPIAIDEYYPAQYPAVVNAGFAVGFWKEWFKTRHLRVG
jgi:hypothetical protein